jgi:hypothetical protein
LKEKNKFQSRERIATSYREGIENEISGPNTIKIIDVYISHIRKKL